MTKEETRSMVHNYDIFISYSRHDLEKVKPIKEEIERITDASCWMDLDGIESGEQFKKVIISAINRCPTMLFMLSTHSIHSDWALDELDFAKKKEKRLVIVYLEYVEQTDEFYFTYHKFDQIDWNNSQQREKLFRDIAKWTGKENVDESLINRSTTNKDALINKGRFQLKNHSKWLIAFLALFLLCLVLFKLGSLSGEDVRIVEETDTIVKPIIVTEKECTSTYWGDYLYTGPVDEEGLPHGNGKAVMKKTGECYVGPFSHGIAEGDSCIYTWPTGEIRKFVGRFKDGVPVEGYCITENGESNVFLNE